MINRQIGTYDVCTGVMWKRFGTPTDATNSGTEEECVTALERCRQTGSPHILFYFNEAPYACRSQEEARQWEAVLAFKERLQGLSL